MNCAAEFAPVEELIHRLRVSKRRSDEFEVALLLQESETSLFNTHIVVVVHRIQSHDIVAVCQESAGDVKTDETSRASDQDFHQSSSVRSVSELKTYCYSELVYLQRASP